MLPYASMCRINRYIRQHTSERSYLQFSAIDNKNEVKNTNGFLRYVNRWQEVYGGLNQTLEGLTKTALQREEEDCTQLPHTYIYICR